MKLPRECTRYSHVQETYTSFDRGALAQRCMVRKENSLYLDILLAMSSELEKSLTSTVLTRKFHDHVEAVELPHGIDIFDGLQTYG